MAISANRRVAILTTGFSNYDIRLNLDFTSLNFLFRSDTLVGSLNNKKKINGTTTFKGLGKH